MQCYSLMVTLAVPSVINTQQETRRLRVWTALSPGYRFLRCFKLP